METTNKELLELQQTLYASKNPTRRWLHCTRRDWIIAALERYSAGGRGRALEVGPGSGVYLPVLARLFPEVTALDLEEAYLSEARRYAETHPALNVIAGDITRAQFPDGFFDLILCTEVVEHIPDVTAAVREMYRLLRPGGVLVLSTPQRYSSLEIAAKVAFQPGIVQLVRLVYGEPVLEMGHISLMTANEAASELESAGFKIRERFKSGMYLPGIAELMGESGLKIEKWIEQKIRGGRLDGVLWTQYYVAEA